MTEWQKTLIEAADKARTTAADCRELAKKMPQHAEYFNAEADRHNERAADYEMRLRWARLKELSPCLTQSKI